MKGVHRRLSAALTHSTAQKALFAIFVVGGITGTLIEWQASPLPIFGFSAPEPRQALFNFSAIDPPFTEPDSEGLSWSEPIGFVPPPSRKPYGQLLLDPTQVTHFPSPDNVPVSGHVVMTSFLGDDLQGNKFFARFFGSLRRSGCDALIILFANQNVAADIRAKLTRWNVHVVSYTKSEALSGGQFWISSLRFLLYRLAVMRLGSSVRTVMVSDLFDVYFQRNPFPLVERALQSASRALYVALEPCVMGAAGQPDDGLNIDWITKCFGDAPLKHVQGKFVSCSGTTFGLRNAMLRYLTLMDRVARQNESFRCSWNGVDQGVHNVIIYRDLEALVLHDPVFSGIILTGNGVTDWLFDGEGNDTLVNRHGEPYAVVHQPNRCAGRGDPTRFWRQSSLSEAAGAKEPVSTDPSAANFVRFNTSAIFRRDTRRNCQNVAWPRGMDLPLLWG